MAGKTNSIVAALTLDTSPFSKGLKKATSNLQSFGSKISSIGRELTFALGLPLVAAAKNAYETAKSFELVQAKIQGIAGADKPLEDLVNSARRLGESTIFSATQVAELQLELTKLGKSKNTIIQLQQPILNFAQAMDTDLAESAKFIAQTLNRSGSSLKGFRNETEKATYVSDVFARATQLSALSADTLRNALNYVGAEANAAGVPFEKTVALLGLLANRGYEGSKAGTKLRYIFTQLAKTGADVNTAIDQLTSTNSTFLENVELVGVRSAGAAASLALTADEVSSFESALRNSSGTTQRFSDALDDTTFKLEKELTSAIQELQLKVDDLVGEDLKEFFRTLTESIRNLKKSDIEKFVSLGKVLGGLLAFSGLSAILGPIIRLIGYFGGALKPLLTALPSLAKVTGFLSESFAALRTSFAGLSAASGTALGAITIFIGGMISLANKIYTAKSAVKDLEDQKKSLDDAFQDDQSVLEALAPDEVVKRLEKGGYDAAKSFYTGAAAYKNKEVQLGDESLNIFSNLISERDYQLFNNLLDKASKTELFGQSPFEYALYEFKVLKGLINKTSDDYSGEPVVNVFDLDADRSSLKQLQTELSSLYADYSKKGAFITEDELARANELEEEIKTISERIAKAAPPSDVDQGNAFFFSDKFVESADDLNKAFETFYKTGKDIMTTDPLDNILKSGDELEDKLTQQEDTLSSLVSLYNQLSDSGNDYINKVLLNYISTWQNAVVATKEQIKAQKEQNEILKQQAEDVENLALSVGSVFGSAIQQAINGTKSFSDALKDSLVSAAAAAIAQITKLIVAYLLLLAVKSIAAPGSVVGSAAARATSGNMMSFLFSNSGLSGFKSASSFGGGNSTLISGSNLVVATNRGITAQDRIYG